MTMDDLIRRDDALAVFSDAVDKDGEVLFEASEYSEYKAIEALPSVEPERKPGRWIGDFCSECGVSKYNWFLVVSRDSAPFGTWNFCPHCGAKMEVEHD